MAIELTTVPTETAVDVADIEYFVDVSETPDAINQITTQNRHNSFAASTTEALTGTSVSKHVTPDALAALWEQGSDVASAGTISVGEGGYFNVTGTTTITDIDFATDRAGRLVWLKFAGALTLTHNATTLILPTGANITTAAGDIACFVSEGTDNVRCVSYTRASGAALVGGGIGGSTGATDNRILRADGTGGATAQSSGAEVDDNGYLAITVSSGLAVPNVYGLTDTNSGLCIGGGDNVTIVAGGLSLLGFSGGASVIQTASSYQYTWSSGGTLGAGSDTGLGRHSAAVIKATNGSTGINAFLGGGASVASAAALPLPTGRVFHVTGTTNITSITSTNFSAGVVITLIFDGILTLTDGGNLKLVGNFVTAANSTISLIFDGTNWFETCRSAPG